MTWIERKVETRTASGVAEDPWADKRGGGFSYVVQRPTSLAIHFDDNGIVINYQLLEL